MRRGILASQFTGVASKRLSAVEASPGASNQHEFNGVAALKALFGEGDRQTMPARFFRFSDEQESLIADGFLTWYDARERHPTRSEYRLYFPRNEVTAGAREGDVILFASRADGSVLAIIVDPSSTIWNQLAWLFGLDRESQDEFDYAGIAPDRSPHLIFSAKRILEDLGLEVHEQEPDAFGNLVEKFGIGFPSTVLFSEFARASLPDVDARDAPDEALLAWMEREEALFRHLERLIVTERLKQGFEIGPNADVDGFLAFSLSVQNRRKSRAGYAFAHHTEAVLKAHGIRYTREATTEKRNAADFLFPGEAEYQKPGYPAGNLRMLAVKTTLKDRWRQVLAEADRIRPKHLLTLEPAISIAQTGEMQSQGLQLVVPAPLHETFLPLQSDWLMSVRDFLALVAAPV